MKNSPNQPHHIVDFSTSYLQAFSKPNSRGHHQLRPPARNRWQHPPADSTFNSLGATGIGVVARDSSSACLAWISHRIYRPVAPLIAEAIAAREAISFAIKSGCGKVILEGEINAFETIFASLLFNE
ncbi:UNVERIFIED_CONTAM: hypothetical protein Sradi_6125400 [Sesamum radiatum]|uniref:RNase H type-1 domain-containing protein n=1 Tax=Sesamum radiatum TaxID=300843 RepID=A0AAW2KJS5_SESRA